MKKNIDIIDSTLADWVYEALNAEVKKKFHERGTAVYAVKGKTEVEFVTAEELAVNCFDGGDGYFAEKDYDRETELDQYPCFVASGYAGAYEVNLIEKTVKWLDYADDDDGFNLEFFRKNLSDTLKYMVFSVYDDYGTIVFIDKLN